LIFFLYSKGGEESFKAGNAFITSYVKSLARTAEMARYSGNTSYISLYANVPKGIDSLSVKSFGPHKSLIIATVGTDTIAVSADVNITIDSNSLDKLTREGRKTINISYDGQSVTIS
ncbi:MAG: hypothetical protein D6769_00200, partial [Methanobacteriota archaeon]